MATNTLLIPCTTSVLVSCVICTGMEYRSTYFETPNLKKRGHYSEMKRIQASGTGSRPKQAEIITEEEEEMVWQSVLLRPILCPS